MLTPTVGCNALRGGGGGVEGSGLTMTPVVGCSVLRGGGGVWYTL